ncbi:hypothetical protein CBL_02040 [Carabus blaptoides fortunei]
MNSLTVAVFCVVLAASSASHLGLGDSVWDMDWVLEDLVWDMDWVLVDLVLDMVWDLATDLSVMDGKFRTDLF